MSMMTSIGKNGENKDKKDLLGLVLTELGVHNKQV